jgi:hypothetical protein
MADSSFSVIFNDIIDVGNCVSNFFDTALGQAAAKGLKTLSQGTKREVPAGALDDGQVSVRIGAFQRTPDIGYLKSNDFSATERQWLERMQRFSAFVDKTEVKK